MVTVSPRSKIPEVVLWAGVRWKPVSMRGNYLAKLTALQRQVLLQNHVPYETWSEVSKRQKEHFTSWPLFHRNERVCVCACTHMHAHVYTYTKMVIGKVMIQGTFIPLCSLPTICLASPSPRLAPGVFILLCICENTLGHAVVIGCLH